MEHESMIWWAVLILVDDLPRTTPLHPIDSPELQLQRKKRAAKGNQCGDGELTFSDGLDEHGVVAGDDEAEAAIVAMNDDDPRVLDGVAQDRRRIRQRRRRHGAAVRVERRRPLQDSARVSGARRPVGLAQPVAKCKSHAS